MNAIQKNEIIEGKVIDLTHEGHGVVKLDRYPIFVPNALINETIEFKVIKVKKNFAIGKLLEIKKESEERVEPPCVYYHKCGGCQLQHMTYQAQLNMKKEQVVNLFHRKQILRIQLSTIRLVWIIRGFIVINLKYQLERTMKIK